VHLGVNKALNAYRVGSVVVQALPPQLNPLHGPQVGAGPVKPLVVAVAPLAVMDEYFFAFVVDLLYVGSIPTRQRELNSADVGEFQTFSCRFKHVTRSGEIS